MRLKTHIYLTFKEKILVDFWVDKTSDQGLSLGLSSLGSDLHLTTWGSKGKIRYHIRHKGIEQPPDESPIGRQTSIRLVGSRVEKMLKRRLTVYRGNRTCWVFTQKRWTKIQSLLPRVDVKGHLHIPLELIFSELDMDFSKKNLWRKTDVRSLLTDEPHFGFIKLKHGTLRLVAPISENQMLIWPLSKVDEIQEYMIRVIGLEEFMEYMLQTDDGKGFMLGAKNQLKRLINS